MYTLYYSPGACSLAIHTILNLIGQKPAITYAGGDDDFKMINPLGAVPVLAFQGQYQTEGASIILSILERHDNTLLPSDTKGRQRAIEHLMLANATLHPAYSKLFFANKTLTDEREKHIFFRDAAKAISTVWLRIESLLENGPYLGGDTLSPADVLLAVYSRWGQFFPVDIEIGPKTREMITLVLNNPAFIDALNAEEEDFQRYES